MMRGRARPHFPTGIGTGTASGSVENGVVSETRSENGDAPALGTGGDVPGVVTRKNGDAPGREARTRTGIASVEAAGVGSGHGVNESARRSCEVVEVGAIWRSPLRPVTCLLMMGLLGTWVLMALMVQRRKVGIGTAIDVGATAASGTGVGTAIGTAIASISGGSGVVKGEGMRPEVGAVVAARTTGWRVWATMAETCT